MLFSVLTHELVGFFTGLFAKVGVDRDVPTEDGLDAAKEISDDRSGADR